MEMKKYLIKSDTEGYFAGMTGEPDGSFWFTEHIENAEQYSTRYEAVDEIERLGLGESFKAYIIPVLMNMRVE